MESLPPAVLVHVVDDDAAVRTALARLLASDGHAVECFESADAFLSRRDPRAHGCLVLDIAMPGLNGLALQHALVDNGCHLPIVFLSGAADVPLCIEAMKLGAFDFLTKPVDDTVLLQAVARALDRDLAVEEALARRTATEGLLATLTPRENEVLAHVMAGRLNKQIAGDLGIAEKTIKVHRARGMEKMHVRSVAELVRLVERAKLALEDAGRHPAAA